MSAGNTQCQIPCCCPTQVRKPAEEAVKALSAQPALIPELLACVQHAECEAAVRQLAAVLLRKRISKRWPQLGLQGQQSVQAVLLQQIEQEPVHVVRRSLADVVAVSVPLHACHQWKASIVVQRARCKHT